MKKQEKVLVEWMCRVQELIEEASGPVLKRGQFKGHSRTKPKRWLKNLVDQVDEVRPKKDEIDENIWMARLLGYILVLWSSYVSHAKSRDPRRPIKSRQKAESMLATDTLIFLGMLKDRPGIKKVFPGQKWEDPFSENATDGTFV